MKRNFPPAHSPSPTPGSPQKGGEPRNLLHGHQEALQGLGRTMGVWKGPEGTRGAGEEPGGAPRSAPAALPHCTGAPPAALLRRSRKDMVPGPAARASALGACASLWQPRCVADGARRGSNSAEAARARAATCIRTGNPASGFTAGLPVLVPGPLTPDSDPLCKASLSP